MTADVDQAAVERVLSAVGPLPSGRRPVLVVLVGLPGSGKSRLAGELQANTGAVVLESDHLRDVLFRRPTYEQDESRALFRVIHAAADWILRRGAAVVVDATNLREWEREPLYRVAEERDAKLILVRLVAPRWLTHRRLREREAQGTGYSRAGVAVYERMKFGQQPISRSHLVVNTAKGTGVAVRRITEEMEGP